MGKIIEFKTVVGQRVSVNADYIVLVADSGQSQTRVIVAVGGKNANSMPLDVVGSYDSVIQKIVK